ncbi:VolA/Pla-1 family phospholipase [Vibrio alfacsensis]|uniref:VolA/Pla-1 family phospholipase n=1 Tax=Vibrio alfacsensis TaxID=1074311 RepID=UPI001BEDCCEC|nr:VolA/Pla-1 family phospholipase [Vibrio alfacsensis]BCN26078.1 lipase [Vibrio alfacsensis]
MKHTFKLSLLCSAILLAGCGDNTSSSGTSDSPQFEESIQTLLERNTNIDFTLQGTNANVPLPSFLLMDSSDGTLGLPTGGDESLMNPLAAMNTMDGWSTSMPIVLNFKGNGFKDGLVTSGVSVIKLTQPLTSIDGTTEPIEKVLTMQDGMTPDADFQVVSSGNSLYIQFADALDESSEYIFAVSGEILDKNDEKIGTSSSYATVKQSDTIYTVGDLASVQGATHAIEQLFTAAAPLTGVDPTNIVYSSWFSTQSVGDTLTAVKGITGLSMADPDKTLNDYYKIPEDSTLDLTTAYLAMLGEPQDFVLSLNENDAFSKYISDDQNVKNAIIGGYSQRIAQGAPHVEVTKGKIDLPHYLETGENWNQTPMQSAMPSLAKVVAALNDPAEAEGIIAQLVGFGIDPSKLATDIREQMKLVGTTLSLSNGSQLDTERVITRYAPVPQVKSLESVNILVFTPKDIKPTNAVIYQHGITSAKENAYAFAYNLAQAGVAVIAIDLPLHGERSLDEQRSANANILAYLNLEYLPVARDNVRQSELDMMGLRAGLSVSLGAGLFNEKPLASMAQVKALGHSLGGIVATTAVAAANKPIPGLTEQEQAALTGLYGISGMSIHNSGGQIAHLLLNSPSYGNMIKHSIAYSGSSEYQQTFESLVAQGQCSADISMVGACFAAIYAGMSESQQASVDGAVSQFGYATQTVLDTIDPFTNAADVSAELPVFMSQVQNDQTVPNSAPNTFAGTEPLAAKLGLASINGSTSAPATGGNLFKYQGNTIDESGMVVNTVATHSTFVAPQLEASSDLPYHADMQARNIEFLTTNALNAPVNTNLMEIAE